MDNKGVFFVEADHPVCEKCISSLDRESCNECGGDGWTWREDDEFYEEAPRYVTCPECFGEPCGWFCPTCHRHWKFEQVKSAWEAQ